ncbi:uncharacterized protein [Medicago truncatula]|uniref:uncharacterized protein n=1 Tax=Medicago truncatula TaxID=3880 RepID=UPI001967B115|nr:uncharacterized protein LOC120576085 [Medicago truncatula]
MTFTEPVVDAPSNVAAEAMPVEKDLELQRQEVHPSLNIQHGLELWERVREYDARAAAEASATKEELLPVLTRNQKQKLKVQHVLATQPHKPRPRALEISCFNSTVYLAAIYAYNYYVKRRELWDDLTNLQGCFQGSWLFVGDFNCILGAHEKRGRRPPPPLSCEDFLNWTNANVLHHLPTLGSFFTWSNGRFGMENVALRLDRAVCNEAWVNFWHQSTCFALVRHQSDHHPLLLSLVFSSVQHANPFKFFKGWTSHVDCRNLVTEVWSKEVRGRGMLRLQAKLRNVKNSFKAWNRNVFGDVDRQVRLAVDEVNRIQLLIDTEGFSDTLYLQDLEAQMLLTNALNVQEQFWKEKARNQHFIHGDRNTAYFHRVSKIRAATNSISLLQDGDNILSEPSDIELHILSYFQGIFSMDNNCGQNTLVDEIIPALVTKEDNQMLMHFPLSYEIKAAVFALNADGAPGPDGFGGHFYQTFWDVVGSDVVQSVQAFFLHGLVPPNINSSMIVLIPKIQGARAMGDYRPIALANFQFKIITKILADRLACITSRIISVEQRGFVRDRNISDCVIIASEAINSLDKRQYGGNIAIKVDISIAFDILDWNFLIDVLNNFGFSTTFLNWILAILHSARLSILINGNAVGFFSCTLGVRQGDPLSPLLFCLVEEVLSRAISISSTRGRLTNISYCRGSFIPTHVLYADDIMIFCTGLKSNIRELLRIFQRYSKVSGQVINNAKNRFYTGAMSGTRTHMIASLLGFSVGTVPFQYLGCTIFQGKPKAIHFRGIIDKIKNKLATWKGRILSIMGRVQLVKSIIHGMLVYSFHVYLWPRRLLRLLDSWLKNFIWSGDVHTRKVCTVAWKVLCRPWNEGRLDIKPTRLINEALILKLSWDLLATDSQWSNLLKWRYFSNGTPSSRYFKSSVWSGIKEFIGTVLVNSLWIVGNGDSINFWTDNWLGAPLVELLNLDKEFHGHLIGKHSEAIINGALLLPTTIAASGDIQARMDSIVLPSSPLPDLFVWQHSSDGSLSSKHAFAFLCPRATLVPWAEVIWSAAIPPSVSFLYWRIHHGKMPTDDNIRTRGCIVVSVCSLCLQDYETIEHLFLSCAFASCLWDWIGSRLNHFVDASSFDSLMSCRPASCSSQVADIFLAAILHTLHSIWWARNAIHFSAFQPLLHSAKVRIHSSIALSGSTSKGKCMTSDYSFLDSFMVPHHNRRTKDMLLVLWKAPSSPWLKVNTDGSVLGGHAACGGIFRDYLGTFRGAFCCNIGIQSVFYSEVLGFIIAIEFAACKGWRHM